MKNYKNRKLKISESTFLLDLSIQRSKEERKNRILNPKHNKLSTEGVRIPHPNDIKETLITESDYQVLF